jgi:hypothetical protein
VVDFLVVDFLDTVGTERLHAGGAGHGGGGDDFGLTAFKKGTEVDLRVEHEFLATIAIFPKSGRSIESRGEAVVGCSDHAVVVVESGGTHFPVGILGAKAGNIGERHGVAGYADAVLGHGSDSRLQNISFKLQVCRNRGDKRDSYLELNFVLIKRSDHIMNKKIKRSVNRRASFFSERDHGAREAGIG